MSAEDSDARSGERMGGGPMLQEQSNDVTLQQQ
jgi:hypothetical protein